MYREYNHKLYQLQLEIKSHYISTVQKMDKFISQSSYCNSIKKHQMELGLHVASFF
jgi:hypothetical protein